MGWDNASTVAQEVEQPPAQLSSRDAHTPPDWSPSPTCCRCWRSRSPECPPHRFSTGAWTDAARAIAGPGLFGTGLALAVVLGGTLNGFGMFNALMLSYTRVPYALALEGLLPKSRSPSKPKPASPGSASWCARRLGRSPCNLSFERLISIDLILYGVRVGPGVRSSGRPPSPRAVFRRDPSRSPAESSHRAVATGIGPTLLIAFALWAARAENASDPFPCPGLRRRRCRRRPTSFIWQPSSLAKRAHQSKRAVSISGPPLALNSASATFFGGALCVRLAFARTAC